MLGRLGCLVVVVVVGIVVQALAADRITAADDSPPADDSTAHAEAQRPIAEPHETRSEAAAGELDLKTLDKELFKRLFVKRRKEHLEAVKNLQKIDSYERQYKMINMLAEKMFEVIESKRPLLENLTESAAEVFSKSTRSDVVDAVSNVLENVALLGDVVLQLPDITRRVLRRQPQWNATMRWSFGFLNRTRDLLDEATLDSIALALQELNVTKREPRGRASPNGIPRGATNLQPKNAKKEREKKRRRKGPTMTRVEL